MRNFLSVAGALAIVAAAPAAAQNAEFARLLAEYDAISRTADPVAAGREGDREARRMWPDVTPAAVAARTRAYAELQQKLARVPVAQLSGPERIDHGLLANRLAMNVQGAPFDAERIPFISGDGFYTVADYVAFGTVIGSEAEAEDWLARLEALPAYLDANVANMRRGLAAGFTQPRLTTLNAIKGMRGQLEGPVEKSSLVLPLATLPASIPAARQQALRARGIDLVRDRVRPAQQAALNFFEKEYLPKTRTSTGISEVPRGRAYYDYLIRLQTTTDMSADEIHQLGITEMARIRAEMAAVMKEVGFTGTLPQFLAQLRSDPRHYATSVDSYIETTAEITKRIDAKVPQIIGRLPRLTFGIKRVPPEVANTSSGYWEGDPKTGLPGNIMIHNEKVLKFPLFQLPAWTLHEGVPGHHTQIALAQEQENVSGFRRRENINAFSEGWGLYAERLGIEMGIYRTPYEQFGRLSYEAWRASRLVIDTGLHAKGWPRQRAVDFLKENTALAQLEIDQEIDRYIAWPGQALAYKIGEIRIRNVRAKAEAALGPKFDVRGFHDAVLANGPVTLSMMEANVDAWVRSRQSAPAAGSGQR